MIHSVDTILQSRGNEGEPHLDISQPDGENGILNDKTTNAQNVELALRERLKELNCLYEISRLVESRGNSLDSILRGIVDLLPPSWQYPEICCARLTLYDREYTTASFQETDWRQSVEIHTNGSPTGVVEVYYLREMPECDEGPFLKEERNLINAIAERTGHIVERVEGEGQLEKERAALGERVKELNCLYGISRLVDQHRDALDPILQGIVDLLPPSWQYPEICCARLTLHGQEHTTANFRKAVWNQSAEIHTNGSPAGAVEVYYLREMPSLDEGPFLKEERDLINAIAERTGKIVERIQAERQLEVERAALQESNIALRRVLAQIDEEKREIHDSIMANVDKILMPVLRALEGEIPGQQKTYVALLRKHLDNLVSPFANRISKAFSTLTPIEIEICNMIQDGLSTKEIAQIRHVSPKTVGKQRERIRKKLHIADPNVNLATHLRIFASG